MKRLPLAFSILLLALSASGQNFPLKPILQNGPPSKNINLVFLPDGYPAAQLDKFIEDVNKITDSMFTQAPFKQYKTSFNVYAILVPSVQSGASHPQTTHESDCANVPKKTNVNNYFGSTYDHGGIHRSLVQLHGIRLGRCLPIISHYMIRFLFL
jgi:hypothetical protein